MAVLTSCTSGYDLVGAPIPVHGSRRRCHTDASALDGSSVCFRECQMLPDQWLSPTQHMSMDPPTQSAWARSCPASQSLQWGNGAWPVVLCLKLSKQRDVEHAGHALVKAAMTCSKGRESRLSSVLALPPHLTSPLPFLLVGRLVWLEMPDWVQKPLSKRAGPEY